MRQSHSNILITGGAGYIGSHVAEVLVKKKYNVIIFDNLITGHKKLINKKAKFIKGDIKNFNKLSKVIKNFNINSIIHLAAFLNVSEAEKNKKKYYKNNVIGTLNLVKACKNSKVRNIIFSSSCSVYGNVNGSVKETTKTNPQGYYAHTKLESEKIIKHYSKKLNYNYFILRYFNVAGASKSGKIGQIESSHGQLIKNLAITSLKKNPKVNIYGNDYNTRDGTCIRDYIHVSDLADIHAKFIQYQFTTKKSYIVNCGYGRGYTVKEVVDIFKLIKKNVVVSYQKRRPGDIGQVFANTKKLKKVIKWVPKFNNMKNIILSSIKWEKKIR
tara:strand:+ start:4164 stop:5147 length:984 start_codon:yes stop_codon:yes gene_type:complete